ncbi:MAG: GIY-YIG nuclease family protein [Hormoscilla sp. GM7CHS1pb]|nr:GIY-YIG nuclease family protein [Hormoscilla sp. GM7CHS1pb]
MTTDNNIPALASLTYLPYLDETGHLPQQLQGKIGIYAIFDEAQDLQLVNYSRDVFVSLKQHLVRQPQSCYWLKVQTIDRPKRATLENIRDAWIAENGTTPPGNGASAGKWTEPIDAKITMTDEEKSSYGASDELGQMKLLKNVARRVEAEIKAGLAERGVQEEIRFNPKLKEKGLLDLK